MKVWNTKNGDVEIIEEVNGGKQLMIKFVATGGIVVASKHKILAGTVKDPMAPRKMPPKPTEPRWNVELADGSSFIAPELAIVSERTGVHLATVYKIAQGTRTNPAIISITRV